MEALNPNGGIRRPEFNPEKPETIFDYAAKMQEWCFDKTEGPHRTEAMYNLAEKLDSLIARAFPDLPEVTVVAHDVYRINVERTDRGAVLIEESIPFKGDEEYFQEHTIHGTLFGYHIDTQDRLRMYIEGDEPPVTLKGGVFNPLFSIGLEGMTVAITKDIDAEHQAVRDRVSKLCEGSPSGFIARIESCLDTLFEPTSDRLATFQEISQLISAIAMIKEAPRLVVDALMEITRRQLEFDEPHTIYVNFHRKVREQSLVPSFQPIYGPNTFKNVTPQVDLIGETESKSLALYFFSEGASVKVPAENIVRLKKENGDG